MYFYIKKVYDKLEAKGCQSRLFTRSPISINEFFEALPPKIGGYIWPSVVSDLRSTFTGKITEVVKVDGVGSGKSMYLVLSLVYGLALLSCLKDPARLFGLMPESKIGLLIMSLRQFQAKEIIYEEVCRILLATPLFENYYPVSERRDAGVTLLKFPNWVYLVSGGGSETLPIGLNILQAVGDELSWFLQKSHKGDDQDQAANIYTTLKERIESRFGDKGLIQLVSSARAANLFLEIKYKESLNNPESHESRRAIWEAKPGKWAPYFAVSVRSARELPGLGLRDVLPYPVKDSTTIGKGVIWIPTCYRRAFSRNPVKFLRDKASIVTVVVKAFVIRPDFVKLNGLRKNPVSSEGVIDPNFKPKDYVYYSHTDLGLNFDKAVVAIGHQESALTVIDLIYKIDPITEGVVDLRVIKAVFFELEKRGFEFGYISFDQFASIDIIQELEKRGHSVGVHSVDKTPNSYHAWLEAHYEDLLDVPVVEGYLEEVRSLIRLPRGTIDHREDGSKDILDAVAGTVWHCRTLGVSSEVSVGASVKEEAKGEMQKTQTGSLTSIRVGEELRPTLDPAILQGGAKRIVQSRLSQMGA